MTEVELKLQDAATQMTLAIANSQSEHVFRSCINSYISAARSVTFVMEANCNDEAIKIWYKERMAQLGKLPLMRFFNSKRVQSIHLGVVRPKTQSHQVEQSKMWTETDENGRTTIAGEMVVSSNSMPAGVDDVITLSSDGKMVAWIFEDCDEFIPEDTGNVLRLCEQYFLLLRALVQDWLHERKRLGLQ